MNGHGQARCLLTRAMSLRVSRICILLLIACLVSPARADELKLAIALFRHGARSPLHFLPDHMDTCKWSEGPRRRGQLTPLGQQQLYDVGLYYNALYVTEHELLSPKYNNSEILIRSSGTDRTVMSAYSVLTGLYPPGAGSDTLPDQVQPVPIRSNLGTPWIQEDDEDRLFHPEADCPVLEDMRTNAMHSKSWEAVEEQYYEFLQRIKKEAELEDYVGSTFHAADIGLLSDPLRCGITQGCGLPPVITQADFEVIMDIHRLKMHEKIGAGVSDQRTRMKGSPMINSWRDMVYSALTDEPTAKMVIYSGHDTTVETMLALLGLWGDDAAETDFGSHLELELWQDPTIVGVEEREQYYIKFRFNGDTMPITACGGVVCSLDDFDDIISSTTVGWGLCVVDPLIERHVGVAWLTFWKTLGLSFLATMILLAVCFIAGLRLAGGIVGHSHSIPSFEKNEAKNM
ncbi:Histidine phosphatase superfamily [Carpediemonas membranifera]|uniref:Histidine phosphatase superfamily n=1 Tax=Carpediemonas membranifera TaxID=201153 RepID=A0A8J6ATR5_9EUKA|nr:Histidine phosphatase superfamily [Carpediemonas membranifera]|eukprot:KAG9393913.1 Histidine phosphatase superfamily [Carpediemonas membranifera]